MKYVDKICNIALMAGDEIMKIYSSNDFQVSYKSDNSPLTLADKASHNIIKNELQKEYPDIPILSEEDKEIPFSERKTWDYFWLVDPLDGTKEFIKKNGEFTVNIALIKKDRPIAGVIYAPAVGLLYFAEQGHGAFKKNRDHSLEKIKVNTDIKDGLIAVKSRSHSSDEENKYFSRFNVKHTIAVGSSLKFCMVAQGKAHLYYRHGPTWEWDTAAGHVIAECAGAKVTNLRYNKNVIKNDSFIVSSVSF